MRAQTGISFIATWLVVAGASCAVETSDSRDVAAAVVSEALKRADCMAQREACAADSSSPSGKAGCRVGYASCLRMAEDGAPEPILAAVAGGATCASQRVTCAAETSQAADGTRQRACADSEAQCVASVLGVTLANVSLADSACVEQAQDCIDRASAAGELTGCGNGLKSCADAVALAAMPPAVTQVVGDVSACRKQLDDCVIAAKTPAEIPACSDQEARCVAQGLEVSLPENVPEADLVECTTIAVFCTLAATNFDSLDSCTRAFDRCVTGDVGRPLTCAERWTQCVGDQLLLLPLCSLELLGCQDPPP